MPCVMSPRCYVLAVTPSQAPKWSACAAPEPLPALCRVAAQPVMRPATLGCADQLTDQIHRAKKRWHVDTGGKAHLLTQHHHILCRHVALGARCERTATQPTH